jgi:hypothetical protein
MIRVQRADTRSSAITGARGVTDTSTAGCTSAVALHQHSFLLPGDSGGHPRG